jgi:hypothetical protein
MGNRIQRAYGIGAPYINVFPLPIMDAKRAPINGVDTEYPQGQQWFFGVGSTAVEYVYQGSGVWATGTPGSISAVTGTANQITATTTGSTVALTIPSTFIAPGSIQSTTLLTGGTGITATTGNITATTGNFVASAAGAGLVLNSGTASGTTAATLNGRSGQITITTPSIAAGATFTFTITNSSVTASTTQVGYWLTGGTTGSAITIQSVTNSAGSSVVVLQNATAVTANTGSLVLTFLVLN